MKRTLVALYGSLLAAGLFAANGIRDWSQFSEWTQGIAWKFGIIANDGGKATFTVDSSSVFQNVSGLTLGGLEMGTCYISNFYGLPLFFTDGAVLNEDSSKSCFRLFIQSSGTVHKAGMGTISFAYGDFSGCAQISLDAGGIMVLTNNAPVVSSGTVRMHGGTILFAPSLASGASGSGFTSTADGAAFLCDAGPSWLTVSKGSGADVSLTLGNVSRTNRGTLAVCAKSGISALGSTEKIFASGEAVSVANGMVSPAFIAHDIADNNAYSFLTYNSASGFVPVAYMEGLGGGAASIANVTTNTTVNTDTSVYALRINNRRTLAIASSATLKIGDGIHPAGLILNTQGTSGTTTISGGSIDFGASEGVIWSGAATKEWEYEWKTISSVIKGSNGLTVGARNGNARTFLVLSGNNTYSGDTHITGGRIQPASLHAFGTGDVYVDGNEEIGAQLQSPAPIPNHIYASGFGLRGESIDADGIGAFNLYGNVTYTNRLTLLADTGIRNDRSTVTWAAPIDGDGGLYVQAKNSSVFVLAATNTYAGKTVANSGTLAISGCGTFGQGEIVNNAAIELDNTLPLTITNAVSGSGTWVLNGSAAVTLEHDNLFLPVVQLKKTETLFVGGTNLSLTLSGNSFAPIQSAAAAESARTVALDGTNDAVYFGTVSDGAQVVNFEKAGSGTLTLAAKQGYSGSTVVREGTLRLQDGIQQLPTAGLSYDLDATDSARVLTDGQGQVTNWSDSAENIVFGKTAEPPYPTLAKSALNKKDAIYFAGNTNRLATATATQNRALFIVNRPTGAQLYSGIWGQDGNDFGIRLDAAGAWQVLNHTAMFNRYTPYIINGVSGNSFTSGETQILFAQHEDAWSGCVSLGNYIYTATVDTPRSYIGYIGEVAAYSTLPSDADRMLVEDYLARKWMGHSLHSTVSSTGGVLPSSTALSILNRATLDLHGSDQTVASLSGEGIITNSSDTAVTLTVTGGCSFKGIVAPNVTLVIAGSAGSTLCADIFSAADTVLDGGTFTLSAYNAAPVQTGLLYWLDAARPETVLCNDSGFVTNWLSVKTDGLNFLQPGDRTFTEPSFVGNAINGKGAVRFLTNRWMAASAACRTRSIFILTVTKGFTSYNGIWAPNLRTDSGMRQSGANSWNNSAPAAVGQIFWDGVVRINGVNTLSFTPNSPYVLYGSMAAGLVANALNALGGYIYYDSDKNRGYIGDIGEVLAYDRELTDAEIHANETYLQGKWFASGAFKVNAAAFSGQGGICLKNGATVDLGGGTQTVRSLGGSGSFRNGTLALDGTLNFAVASDGTAGTLALDSHFDLSKATLNITGQKYLNKAKKYTVLTAAKGISGNFKTANVPLNWQLSVRDNAVYLLYKRGTVVMLM